MTSLRTPQLPRKEPLQARSKALCDVILIAAARVFDQLGYARTTTNRVAAVAGVSVGSLYQYYPNKSALITALHERHNQEVARMIARHLASEAEAPPAIAVGKFVRELLAMHRVQPQLQVILHGRMPYLKRSSDSSAAKKEMFEPVLRWLRRHGGEQRTVTEAYLLNQMAQALVHAATLEPPAFCDNGELAVGIETALLRFVLG